MALFMVSLSMVLLSFCWMLIAFESLLPASISEQELFQDIVKVATPWVTSDPDSGALDRLMSTGKFIAGFCAITFAASFIRKRGAHFKTLSDEEVERVGQLIRIFDQAQEEHDQIWESYSSDIDGQAA